MNNEDFLKVSCTQDAPSLSPIRHNILLLILFFCVALSLMAPIASNDYLPKIVDYRNHTALIVQAKMALDEGQFPVRVTPYEHQSLNYPLFQFYSPFVYTLSGAIYKWLTPDNPYLAFKLTALLAFLLAGVYSYRSAFLLTQNSQIAILAALTYMCAPYFIVNLQARGAFTEFFAQSLLPIVLYYTLLVFRQRSSVRELILLAFSWAVLAQSHTITFVYTSLFMGLLILALTFIRFQPFTASIKVGIAYLLGCLLSLWMFAPMHLMQPFIMVAHTLQDPSFYNWLTPLSSLVSFTAVSPMPLPGNGLLTTKIYVSLGLPMLIALGMCIIRLFSLETSTPSRRFFCAVMGIYFIALLFAWAPFDVYAFLPKILHIAQFNYRLLSQTLWIGLILFIIFLSSLCQNEETPRTWFIVFAALILLSIAPWVQTQQDAELTIESIVKDPHSGYGKSAYLPSITYFFPDLNQKTYKTIVQSLVDDKHKQRNLASTLPFLGAACHRQKSLTLCEIQARNADQLTPLPSVYYPGLLKILVDGNPTPYYPTMNSEYVLAGVNIPKGPHQIIIQYVGVAWANTISLITFVLLLSYMLITTATRIWAFAALRVK